MSVSPPLGEIKESLAMLPLSLAGILGIALLTAACNTTPIRQTQAADKASTKTTAHASGDKVATKKEKLVCHYETALGSNISRKVCATKKSWEASNEKSRKEAEEFTRRSREQAGVTSPLSPAEQQIGRGTVSGPMNQ